MGVLILILSGAGWLIALLLLLSHNDRAALKVSGSVAFLGGLAAVAPLILPRNWFGELGHGDGMGMIGLTLVGMLVLAVSGILVAIAALRLKPTGFEGEKE